MQANTTPEQPKKLLDQVRDKIRFKHYSLSTENTYLEPDGFYKPVRNVSVTPH